MQTIPHTEYDYNRLHIFEGVNDSSQIKSALSASRRIRLADGELLIEANTVNHFLYILLAGQLDVRLTLDTNEPVKTILPGELAGEMSIIDGHNTSAYVISSGDSELLALHEDDFWRDLAPLPYVMRNLTRLVVHRLRTSSEQIIRNLEQQLKFEQLKQELAAAREIQMGSLPHQVPLLPEHQQVEVFAHLLPAKEVGGDLYDAYAISDNHIMVAVGDVVGKGMPAALFMMRTLALLRAQARSKEPLEQLLPALNRLLCEDNETGMFVTLSVAILSVDAGSVLLLNGGHPAPLISRQGGSFQTASGAKGALLGISPDARYKGISLVLEPGDRMLLYSDGVIEAENSAAELFAIERTLDALNQCPPDTPSEGLVAALTRAVVAFSGEADQSDDITILALRYMGP
jgi:sigma-B regulation protein RsbU (phosphoserine phosphatase)